MGFAGLGFADLGLVEFAPERPANIVSIIPVGPMEVGAGLPKSVDVLPEIDIPVDF